MCLNEHLEDDNAVFSPAFLGDCNMVVKLVSLLQVMLHRTIYTGISCCIYSIIYIKKKVKCAAMRDINTHAHGFKALSTHITCLTLH